MLAKQHESACRTSGFAHEDILPLITVPDHYIERDRRRGRNFFLTLLAIALAIAGGAYEYLQPQRVANELGLALLHRDGIKAESLIDLPAITDSVVHAAHSIADANPSSETPYEMEQDVADPGRKERNVREVLTPLNFPHLVSSLPIDRESEHDFATLLVTHGHYVDLNHYQIDGYPGPGTLHRLRHPISREFKGPLLNITFCREGFGWKACAVAVDSFMMQAIVSQ
jgi:hypothetical protein